MASYMGDGDLVDPEFPDDGADDDAVAGAGTDASDAVRPLPEDEADDGDVPERASEIDDITDSIPRIDIRYGGASGADAAGDDDPESVSEAGGASTADVEALVAERDDLRRLAQRVQADFDNYRRRAQAQAEAEADRAAGRLAQALLPVLDAAEAAYVRHPDEVGPLLNQMLTELKKQGLETLDLDGQPFDPEVAEAVAHEPGDGNGPVVAEVLRSGYRWKGRTLRAAMVRTKD